MKTDKTKLLKDIEAMKEKLASMEKELNKTEEFKHFPSKGEVYYFYTSSKGAICSNTASDNNLKVNAYRTEKEAEKAYNKAVAVEKIKRRILELQGDWKPDFNDACNKYTIRYDYRDSSFVHDGWRIVKHYMVIPYMKDKETVDIIINEFHKELKLIFDIS